MRMIVILLGEAERVNREGRKIVLRERERITILLRGSEGANKNEYKELGRYTIPKRARRVGRVIRKSKK